MIRLYWWPEQNFGDALSPLIVERVLGEPVLGGEPLSECDLVAAGSVLEQLHDSDFAGVIWGSGLIGVPDVPISLPHARVAAVRGHLTRRRLSLPPETPVGDPGLLAHLLVRRAAPVHALGVVPHKVDRADQRIEHLRGREPEIVVVDVTDDPLDVLRTVARCRAILSSSLHGLVVADALGIPNGWIVLSDGLIGSPFKFHDYYSAFGAGTPVPQTIEPGESVRSLLARAAPPQPAATVRPVLEQALTRVLADGGSAPRTTSRSKDRRGTRRSGRRSHDRPTE